MMDSLDIIASWFGQLLLSGVCIFVLILGPDIR